MIRPVLARLREGECVAKGNAPEVDDLLTGPELPPSVVLRRHQTRRRSDDDEEERCGELLESQGVEPPPPWRARRVGDPLLLVAQAPGGGAGGAWEEISEPVTHSHVNRRERGHDEGKDAPSKSTYHHHVVRHGPPAKPNRVRGQDSFRLSAPGQVAELRSDAVRRSELRRKSTTEPSVPLRF